MRCRVGDLCIVVKSLAGNEGRVVRCVQYVGNVRGLGGPHDWWLIDQTMRGTIFDSPHQHDSWMRPIHPGEGTDETLTWAGKPHETPTEIIRRETERVS